MKHIRDVLYGMISMSQTELDLINTEAFLRLHRIKQLSHAYVVYPSALHTRFEHSLGAMHVAGLMCEKLELSHETTRLVRIAALLHDIGHGPFSHLFESVLGPINSVKGPVHEHITRMMILDDPDIKKILGGDRHVVAELLDGDKTQIRREHRLASDIVSSNLDADKLDYLARDSYHLGVNYGKFDFVRILHTLCGTPDGERLGVLLKGHHALENYRLARHLMTAQVYGHHARLAADQMFLKAILLAIEKERVMPKENLRLSSGSFLSFYKKLDDCSIYDMVVSSEGALTSKEILLDIRARRLLKRVYEVPPLVVRDDSTRSVMDYRKDKLHIIAKNIRSKLQLDEHMLIVHESDIILKLYGKRDIPCVLDDGEVMHMNSLSPINAHSEVLSYYIFGPATKREQVGKMFKDADVTSQG